MKKLKNAAARCIVKLLNSSDEFSFTCLSGENITGVEHLQEFGFASRKPSDSDANGIALFYGGDKGNASLLVLEVPAFKPDLDDGEAALFNAFSAIVKLASNGNVELNGTGNLGLVKITELTAKLNAHITEYNTHMHPTAALGSPSVPSVPGTVFVASDYENTKVVH